MQPHPRKVQSFGSCMAMNIESITFFSFNVGFEESAAAEESGSSDLVAAY
jgi:hypothetical protein